jgi:hypothetical protein
MTQVVPMNRESWQDLDHAVIHEKTRALFGAIVSLASVASWSCRAERGQLGSSRDDGA